MFNLIIDKSLFAFYLLVIRIYIFPFPFDLSAIGHGVMVDTLAFEAAGVTEILKCCLQYLLFSASFAPHVCMVI